MAQKSVGKYRIQRFDPDVAFKEPFNMVLLGRKHTGKSCLMRDLLYHLNVQGYPRVVVFSGTEEGNHFFSRHVPNAYVYNQLDVDAISRIVETQKQVVAAVREVEEKTGKPCGIDARVLLVLDDVVYQKGALSNDVFRNIFFQGRHNKISLIIASQYLMYVPIEHRGNIDFLVCMKENIPRNKVKLYESFFGCFENKQVFSYVLDQLTRDYEVCILDNTCTDNDPNNCVRWYKADINLPTFKFYTLL